jgi:hypothetical protein
MIGSLLCFQKTLLKRPIFNRKARLKIDSAASTGKHGKYKKIIPSFGLRWWQHMIIRSIYEYSLAVEVIGSVKNTNIPRITLCSSYSTFPFQLRIRRFPTKLPSL